MAATMASTLALSRPSEKFGTHSTSVDIREKNSWRALTEARRTGVIALSYGVQFPHSFWLSTATKIRIAEFGGHFVHGRTDQDAPCGRCGGCPYRHHCRSLRNLRAARRWRHGPGLRRGRHHAEALCR